jgi:hypothetical protein
MPAAMHARCPFLLLGSLALVSAAELPSPSGAILENLAAANRARADLAADESDWRGERARLQAVIAAARAEGERLDRDAATAEAERDARRAELGRLGTTSELLAVRATLGEAGERVAGRLAGLAARLAPGAVTPPPAGDAEPFAAAAIALDGAERATTQVTTTVVVGELNGARAAAKVLRVAGAAAWWVSLDGKEAGTVSVEGGEVRLKPAADDGQRDAIRSALAMVEGRKPPAPTLLPLPTEGAP